MNSNTTMEAARAASAAAAPYAGGTAVAQRDDFQAFHREFEEQFQNLARALSQSQAVKTSAAAIGSKGTMKMLWGTFSGGNDKELAQMTSDLAASLVTTQTVLQISMQLGHRKNSFLRDFHQVLVNKIAHLAKDSGVLEENQRDAVIYFLEELKDHVSAQIEQQDRVNRHQVRLDSIDLYRESADAEAAQFRHRLSAHDAAVLGLHEADKALRAEVDAQGARFEAQRAQFDAQRGQLDAQRGELDAQRGQLDAQRGELDAQRVQLDAQRAGIEEQAASNRALGERIAAIEGRLDAQARQLALIQEHVARLPRAGSVWLSAGLACGALVLAAVALVR